jgi:hypothetical protein
LVDAGLLAVDVTNADDGTVENAAIAAQTAWNVQGYWKMTEYGTSKWKSNVGAGANKQGTFISSNMGLYLTSGGLSFTPIGGGTHAPAAGDGVFMSPDASGSTVDTIYNVDETWGRVEAKVRFSPFGQTFKGHRWTVQNGLNTVELNNNTTAESKTNGAILVKFGNAPDLDIITIPPADTPTGTGFIDD